MLHNMGLPKNTINKSCSASQIFFTEFLKRFNWFLALKIVFENQKFANSKGSFQNLSDKYGKTLWIGYFVEQSCTSSWMRDQASARIDAISKNVPHWPLVIWQTFLILYSNLFPFPVILTQIEVKFKKFCQITFLKWCQPWQCLCVTWKSNP